MQGEEEVTPKRACTLTGLVHGTSEGANTMSLPVAEASATVTTLPMEPHTSYILYPREMPGSMCVLLLISAMAKSIAWAYWNPLKFRLNADSYT